MNPDEVTKAEVIERQYRLALQSVFECLDRVCADPKSVVRWTSAELTILGAARSLIAPTTAAKPTTAATV